jgi:hypothetical protein
MRQSANRTGVIGNAGIIGVNVYGGDKACECDQQDAKQRHGAVRPASGPQIRLACHSAEVQPITMLIQRAFVVYRLPKVQPCEALFFAVANAPLAAASVFSMSSSV